MDHERMPNDPAAQVQRVDDTAAAPQPEHIRILTPGSGESSGSDTGRDTRPHTGSSTEQQPLNPNPNPNPNPAPPESHAPPPPPHDNPYADFQRVPAVPRVAHSRDGHVRLPSRRLTVASNSGPPDPSGLDWIVPLDEKRGSHLSHARRTVGERLQPTIDNAEIEKNKYARKAVWTGYALNIAIGLQVFLGAMTTALAAALQTGKQAQISTSILGGLSTLVASYMARARGSGEPELSITRVKDLEQFIRECKAFQMDHAHEYSTPENGLGERLADLRRRFEELLGNADGARRLSPVGVAPSRAAA